MMNSQDKETLSAMLDNEADELELRRILKTAGDDPQLADTWQRMSLVQAVLHDDNVKDSWHLIGSDSKFSATVMQAIAAEPVPQSSGVDSDGKVKQWTQPLAKLGIAASVALAFFLGMQISVSEPGTVITPMAQQQSVEGSGEVDSSATIIAVAADSTAAESTVREVDPEARQRLEEYIQSVSITRDEPQQLELEQLQQSSPLEQLQNSPLYRVVNEVQDQ